METLARHEDPPSGGRVFPQGGWKKTRRAALRQKRESPEDKKGGKGKGKNCLPLLDVSKVPLSGNVCLFCENRASLASRDECLVSRTRYHFYPSRLLSLIIRDNPKVFPNNVGGKLKNLSFRDNNLERDRQGCVLASWRPLFTIFTHGFNTL